MGRLCTNFHINDGNLRLRRDFIGLETSDLKLLASLAGWARRVAPKIASEFYDFQFEFGPTTAFFNGMAARKGMSMQSLRSHLEAAQVGYFTGIFEEPARGGEFGTDYFERRLHVGSVHNVIDLPLKWYIGSYTTYQKLASKYLRRSFWYRPRFVRQAEAAIGKVFNYDMQAVSDSFFLELVTSLGFDPELLAPQSSDKDSTENFRRFKEVVRDALVGMISASNDLAGAGAQITSAAQHVASSVQEQAASLEETSSTIEEISSGIKQTAQNAKRANQLAVGGEGKRDTDTTVLEAMQNIDSASKRIENIIGVINELAFQTNLLALNAAVEAARAGEQGRGFAVVASEVRNLAQRSATAAKEIRQLIQDAVGKIDEGSRCVQAVTQLIVEISAAADQQAEGVDQVAKAVGQMDMATQSNAAQAEELNATAGNLASKAGELQGLVRWFKVD